MILGTGGSSNFETLKLGIFGTKLAENIALDIFQKDQISKHVVLRIVELGVFLVLLPSWHCKRGWHVTHLWGCQT